MHKIKSQQWIIYSYTLHKNLNKAYISINTKYQLIILKLYMSNSKDTLWDKTSFSKRHVHHIKSIGNVQFQPFKTGFIQFTICVDKTFIWRKINSSKLWRRCYPFVIMNNKICLNSSKLWLFLFDGSSSNICEVWFSLKLVRKGTDF